MIQVKIFYDTNVNTLEKAVNNFLEDVGEDAVVDIKYATAIGATDDAEFVDTITVVYKKHSPPTEKAMRLCSCGVPCLCDAPVRIDPPDPIYKP